MLNGDIRRGKESFMKNIQLAEGINTGALCDFIKECQTDGTHIRAFQCVKDNTVVAKVAIEPFSFEEPMLVYSLSKSFTSVCVGIAQSEGLLDIEERIADIFPDKCPEEISENLANMRIKDCLCMTSGHAACVFSQLRREADPVRYFLSQPVAYAPGTTFVYSTAATYICGAVVELRSGKRLVDYLYEKVLSKMDIEKPEWKRCVDGSCQGGTGLVISSDTATKFGIMLRDGGVYNGKRIVPEEWIKTASSIHSETPRNGTPDWLAGYGYQFWMNAKEGFRGDGAYGQLCMIFPKRNMVFTLLCEAVNMQKEVDSIYKLLDVIEIADNSRYEELETLTKNLYKPIKNNVDFESRRYSAEKNIAGIHEIKLNRSEDGITVTLECDYGTQKIECGNGFYKKNSLSLMNLTPGIWTDHVFYQPWEVKVSAFYTDSEDEVSITLRHIDAPHTQTWHFPKKGDGDWTISLYVGSLNPQILKTPVKVVK